MVPDGASRSIVSAASTPRSTSASGRSRPVRSSPTRPRDAHLRPVRRRPDGGVRGRAGGLEPHASVHVPAALQGGRLHVHVEHDVAHRDQVHGGEPTRRRRRPRPRRRTHPRTDPGPGAPAAARPTTSISTRPSDASVTSPTIAASIPSRAQRLARSRSRGPARTVAISVPSEMEMYGSIPTWSQTARTSGRTGIASSAIRMPDVGGRGDLRAGPPAHRPRSRRASTSRRGRATRTLRRPAPRGRPSSVRTRRRHVARRRRPRRPPTGRGTSRRTTPSPRSPHPSSPRRDRPDAPSSA